MLLENFTLDSNYFNFKENRTRVTKKHSNDSFNYSYEKIDENKEFPENDRKFLLLSGDESENKNCKLSEEEWTNIINKGVNLPVCGKEREKMISSLMLGIPGKIRGRIWKFLSKCENVSANHPEDFYKKLLKVKTPDMDLQIRKDIERTNLILGNDRENLTNNKNSLINMKKKLFNVLKAYAVYDPQVGYCQGTNFIVMMILSCVNSSKDAFWIFVQIMHDKNWRNLFINNTPKLISLLDKFVEEIKNKFPELHLHFEIENFIEQIPGALTHYFTTIFSYNIPMDYSYRVFDLFWIFEDKIIIDCLIHIMKLKSKVLLEMNSDDLHAFLKNELIISCLKENTLEKCLPTHNRLLEEKEVIIEI